MLRHGDSNPKNITGCLFRDAMTTLRLELGLPGYPFDHSYKRFRLCSTPIYLHRAWEFCNQHEFRIQDNQPKLHVSLCRSRVHRQAAEETESMQNVGQSYYTRQHHNRRRQTPHARLQRRKFHFYLPSVNRMAKSRSTRQNMLENVDRSD
jgi:hypothetical protein